MRQRSLWCRLYSEVARCRKIQTLPDAEFKFLINCWCLAKENDGALPSAADIAWNLHQPEADVAAMISSLKMKRFIDEKDGKLVPHDWSEHQYISDDINARVKKFRAKKLKPRNVTRNVTRNKNETRSSSLLLSVSGSNLPKEDKVLTFEERQEIWWTEIWKEYPRHTGTGGAQKSFRHAATSEAEYAAILAGLRKQLPELRTREQKFIPHFQTWLNQRRWLDEPAAMNLFAPTVNGNGNGGAPQIRTLSVYEKAELRDAELMRRAIERDAEDERMEAERAKTL